MKPSFNYCGICGHVPKAGGAPNLAPVRWWDPDDGWKIGTLCPCCHQDTADQKPKPTDFAVVTGRTNGIADDINTDEDPIELLEQIPTPEIPGPTP